MSTVVPNGQIRFFSGVPIDDTYENTLYFENVSQQTSYFLGLTPVHRMMGATRVRDGVINVNALADTLLTCNYMMFQNTGFSNKWFYAFIENVRYVNNGTTEITYRIDEIQTWFFDVTLGQCYVEREHTATDGMFEHLIEEEISVSEYVTLSEENKDYSQFCAVLFTSSSASSSTPTYANCAITNGVLKGLSSYVFNLQDDDGNWLEIRSGYDDPETEGETIDNTGNGLEKLNLWLYRLTTGQQADSIVGIVIIPKAFVGSRTDVKITQLNAVIDAIDFFNFSSGDSLDGNYVPSNKKLYNSPYCMFNISMSDGQLIPLQPEYLQAGLNVMELISNISPSPSITVLPKHYEGNEFAWEKSISFSDFPQASVALDAYKAWVASGGLKSTQLHMVQTFLGASNQGYRVNPALPSPIAEAEFAGQIIGGTVIPIMQDMNNINVAKRLPPIIKGNTDSTPILANKMFYAGCRKMSLKKDILESIDNYFTMFGYKVNKLKTPQRKNRTRFTYLKTIGCKANGAAPSDSITRIQAIYDNGIRFWVNASDVGNYTTANNPL